MTSFLQIERDHLSQYNYEDPQEVGHFSLDGNRNILFSNEHLKYLAMPRNINSCHFDLNEGYEYAIRKNYLLEEKPNFLQWIQATKPSHDFEFACHRGLLHKILLLPYADKQSEKFIITASKFHGVIYMYVYYDPLEESQREATISDTQKRISSRGFKFEQFMTSDKPGEKSDTTKGVNENEDFCSVVKSKLNSYSLLLAGEIDGIDPSQTKSPLMNRYVELKIISSSFIQSERFLKWKAIDMWAQSYLIGIDTIICGLHQDGVVKSVKEYKTSQLIEASQAFWDPTVCMNFCAAFLKFVKDCVTKDDPNTVVVFEYEFQNRRIKAQEMEPDSSYCFIPTWYQY